MIHGVPPVPQPTVEPRNAAETESQYGDLLKVSVYDRVASLLVAALVMTAAVVAMLVIVWWTSTLLTSTKTQEIFIVEEEGEGEGEEGSGSDRFDAPEMEEPGMEQLDLAEPDVQETLMAVTDAVSSVAATLDAVESNSSTRGQGGSGNRKAGSGVIPRWKRWEIRYISTTLKAYAKQLDFFGIELAAMGGGRPGVDYARFENGQLQARRQPPDTEDKRLYFVWQGGPFQEQDRALMARAGVNAQGRLLCQFFSPELENQLAVLEQQKLNGQSLKKVRRTVFGVRPAGRGFEFYVLEIQWRS